MPEVSVVVPLYNKGPYIVRALNSIANQRYRDFEVIVVNDGSTDNSGEIAESFPDSRFRVLHQKNAGPGAARNHGIAEAKGRLIAFLDADDQWFPEYLETAVRTFDETPKLGALTQGYVDGPDFSPSEALWYGRGFRDGLQPVESRSALMLHYMIVFMNSQSTVAPTAVVRKYGGFYENRCTYGEDSFLWMKVVLNHPVMFTFRGSMVIHREAGDLNFPLRLGRVRPLEPFLAEPQSVIDVCPPHLLPLLQSFLTIRAFKTACAWGYQGDWRRAAEIRRKFRIKEDYRLPWYLSSWVFSTPIGAGLGAAFRSLKSVRRGFGNEKSPASGPNSDNGITPESHSVPHQPDADLAGKISHQ